MCQLYHPEVIRERHGYRPELIPEILKHYGYDLWLMNEHETDRKLHFDSPADLTSYCGYGQEYAVNFLLATRSTG